MTEPRPRGRPKGSKNRPKEPWDPREAGEPGTIDRTNEPATVESWTAGPRGVRLLVRFKSAMSTTPIEEELDWPPGWPVPQLNDTIRSAKNAGRVQYVEYQHDLGLIIITAT